jgi:hypothetical protein
MLLVSALYGLFLTEQMLRKKLCMSKVQGFFVVTLGVDTQHTCLIFLKRSEVKSPQLGRQKFLVHYLERIAHGVIFSFEGSETSQD